MNLSVYIEKIEQIEKNYNYLDGWRLLNCKTKRIYTNNGVVIISLNPGTGRGNYNKSLYTISNEDGNSLLHEKWISPLKIQLISLLNELNSTLKIDENNNNFIENILQGYFIPFRSESKHKLKYDIHVEAFCTYMWQEILSYTIENIKVINCIGKNTPLMYILLILERIGYKQIWQSEFETGWGSMTVNVIKMKKKNKVVTVFGYPHLSHFRIFNRIEGKKYINNMLNTVFVET